MIPDKRINPVQQAAVFGLLVSALSAGAVEYPIGKPQQHFGMEIAAVYLQPVAMEPEGMMRKAEEADIHIEADIKALANRANARGLGDKFHAAWRKILAGLEYRPEEFGDPYTKLHALGLLIPCRRTRRDRPSRR